MLESSSSIINSQDSNNLWIPPISANPKPLSEILRSCKHIPATSLAYDATRTCTKKMKPISQDSDSLWGPPVCAQPDSLSEVLSSPRSIPTPSKTSSRMLCLPIRNAAKMTSPYQNIPSPDGIYYLYEFRFPEPVMLARLVGIAPECFGKPNQTIGFLFSKPIAEDLNVCRVPLYLSRGMARAYIQMTNTVRLSPTQFRMVLSTHHVLSELLCELITRDMSSITSDSATESDKRASSSLFSQFKYDPSNALIAALMCFVTWPGSTVDFEACKQILSGSLVDQIPLTAKTDDIILSPVRGIFPHRQISLARLPQVSWSGLLIRPLLLPEADLGLFACAGSFDNQAAEKNVTKASIRCYRLSRHPQVARVNSGGSGLETANKDSSLVYEARQCIVYPLSAWLWLHLSLIPAVLYQTNRALLSVELARQLTKLCPAQIRVKFPVLLPDRLDAPQCMLAQFHPATELDRQAATSPLWPSDSVARLCDSRHVAEADASNLLEATTTLGAADVVNLERLELLGDALLKFIATIIVYQQLPETSDEGQLTAARMPLISNASLEKTATKLGWPNYCTARPYLARDHFIPPGYTLSDQVDQAQHHQRLFTELNRKSVADMVEAVLGYILTYSDLKAASKLLQYFNLSFRSASTAAGDTAHIRWNNLFNTTVTSYLAAELSTLFLTDSPSTPESHPSQDLPLLERVLRYRFRDLSHLRCALTHGSVSNSTSYERLEFLGDAVLDYVVTLELYRRHKEFDPGDLTQCRSLVICNVSLANIVVKLRIHDYIQHNVADLLPVVREIEDLNSKPEAMYSHFGLLPQNLVKGKPTKLLSDVFEAIIGAIFLDSDGNLIVTSRVILNLLRDRIDFITRTHKAPKPSGF